jgi:hypothetical protein
MVQQKSPISLERNRMHPTHPKIYKFSSYLTGNNTSPLCSQELWPLDHRGGADQISLGYKVDLGVWISILKQ